MSHLTLVGDRGKDCKRRATSSRDLFILFISLINFRRECRPYELFSRPLHSRKGILDRSQRINRLPLGKDLCWKSLHLLPETIHLLRRRKSTYGSLPHSAMLMTGG
jgi:hypothetical protein